MRNRPISILFRVNEMEHRHLKEQVRLSGLPMEQYLRRAGSRSNYKTATARRSNLHITPTICHR